MPDAQRTEDGGSAFPRQAHLEMFAHDGLSLRDYFAGQALTGLLAHNGHLATDEAARFAYLIADNMLEARKTP